MNFLLNNVEYKTSAYLFAGIGGATAGAMRSQVEYGGNAVPPDAQEEMGNVLLLAAAEAEAGISFALSWDPVWVAPVADEIPAIIH